MKISTFVINLEKRKDRLEHIEKEFLDKTEFSLKIERAIENTIPAVGLYQTLVSIIRKGKDKRLPYLLICEDDHQFTHHYASKRYKLLVKYFEELRADVFLGGVSWFECAIKSGDGHSWVNKFAGCQFMLIYSKFYDLVLKTPFSEHDTIDHWISKLSDMIFVAVPMISIQRDFGYSDATKWYNQEGKVAKLFTSTSKRWDALNSIRAHIEKTRKHDLNEILDFKNLKVPTYIINSNDRTMIEFSDKEEFNIESIETFKKSSTALDVWKSIQKIVKSALQKDEDVILICEDKHVFSKSYSSERIFSAIFQGAFLGADILLGMISGFHQAVVVDENLCWIDHFKSTKFLLLYKQFFTTILDNELSGIEDIYIKLSDLTANKYVIHPFISRENDFDYSNIQLNDLEEEKYAIIRTEYNSEKLNAIRRLAERLGNFV